MAPASTIRAFAKTPGAGHPGTSKTKGGRKSDVGTLDHTESPSGAPTLARESAVIVEGDRWKFNDERFTMPFGVIASWRAMWRLATFPLRSQRRLICQCAGNHWY